MNAITARLVAICICLSAQVHAAEITRIASSFEQDDPFGMYVDLTYQLLMHDGKINRENYPQTASQDQLRYKLHDHRLNADIRLGIYRDLELHFGLGYSFAQDRRWGFSQSADARNSSIFNNCVNANGLPASPIDTTSGRCSSPVTLFPFSDADGAKSFRSGLQDLTFGFAWAPLNQRHDETAATWVLSFDYTAPMADAINPTVLTAANARGAVGDKIHRYKFATSISKRVRFADPYFSLHYTLPWRAAGYYTNCDNPSGDRMAQPGNCGKPGWSREQTGAMPSHVGGFIFGSELNLVDVPDRHQKFALDLRGGVTYVSEGRMYNEMSDLFGKLLYSSDYLHLTGTIGLVAHAAEFIHLKASVELGYQTEHNLTNENIGKDIAEPRDGVVNIDTHPEEISPNFDYRIDRVGRRFRLVDMLTTRVQVQVTFSF